MLSVVCALCIVRLCKTQARHRERDKYLSLRARLLYCDRDSRSCKHTYTHKGKQTHALQPIIINVARRVAYNL